MEMKLKNKEEEEVCSINESKKINYERMNDIIEINTSSYTNNNLLTIQIQSDIHLESRINDFVIIPSAPVLALLGDIGYASSYENEGVKLYKFIKQQSEQFEYVLYVSGNHEYWYTSRIAGDEFIEKMCCELPNLYFLNRKTLLLNGYLVSGATLWTRIPRNIWRDAWGCMRDFDRIDEIRCELSECDKGMRVYQMWHCADADWLQEQIAMAQDLNLKIIILTHHAPSQVECICPDDFEMYGSGVARSMNSSSLEAMINESVVLWGFGHTHHNSRRFISSTNGIEEKNGETLLISNQYGHNIDHAVPSYSPTMSITIDQTGCATYTDRNDHN